jgi:hypothetical protein
MSVREEAAFANWVRAFLEQHNRPPTVTEADQLSTDLRCVKFLRAGTLVTKVPRSRGRRRICPRGVEWQRSVLQPLGVPRDLHARGRLVLARVPPSVEVITW